MSHPASPELERFIRATLGCGCPPEVFQEVEKTPTALSLAIGVTHRLAIGGRLLIYLMRVTDNNGATARIPDWVAAGCAERDRLGFNRLRLVLALETSDAGLSARIEQTFAAAAGGDDRLHLHIVQPDQLPALG